MKTVSALASLAACLAFAVIQHASAHAADVPPPLEARLGTARAIAAQEWYARNASLLDDILWQPDGSLIFRDRAHGEYQKLDAARAQFVTLVTFRDLRRMLQNLEGIDLQSLDAAILSPLAFERSGVTVKTGESFWSCDWHVGRCGRYVPRLMDRGEANFSPGRRAGLILQKDNLFLVSAAAPEGVQLTRDGGDLIGYGSQNKSLPRSGEAFQQPRAAWSQDGRYAVIARVDQTGVATSSIVDWLPGGKLGARPEQRLVRDTHFGDRAAGKRTLYVIDTAAQEMRPLPGAAADYTDDPVAAGFIHFSDDGRHVYIIREAEDFHSAQLIEIDLKTLSSRTVLSERPADGGFLYFSGARNPAALHVFSKRNAFVWYSERDGFSHLYLHELGSGKLLKQLTRGRWTVASIVRVTGNEIYFLRTNPEESAEPYNQQLYSVNIDTGRIRSHTDAGMDHAFAWPSDTDVFVQSSASLEMPATLAVREIRRGGVRTLLQFGTPPAEALSRIRESGFSVPTRFRVRSRIEDRVVFGTIYRPGWATSGQKLPVIEKVYPGFCCVPAPWSFPHQRGGRFSIPRVFEPQALAELGFVVVITAGPGSPLRGRAYHQAQHGEGYWDADSLETHIDVLRTLAQQHPEMDLSRVGIYGHSGGGYAAARAILKYPDFYSVAVALSGNHDRRLYGASWPMMYAGHDPHGPNALEGPETATLAGNLRGHLLLMHGDVDSAVLIDSTMQLAGALQRAHKKFDMQVVIGGEHGIDSNPYVQAYYWSYFLEHLRAEGTSVNFQ